MIQGKSSRKYNEYLLLQIDRQIISYILPTLLIFCVFFCFFFFWHILFWDLLIFLRLYNCQRETEREMDVLSYAYRDTTALTRSRTIEDSQNRVEMVNNNRIKALPAEVEGLRYPFGELGIYLTEPELRETAYEILIGACRSSGASRPLTYISNSGKNLDRATSISSSSSPSLQKSVTSVAASKVKKALGLNSRKKGLDSETAADQKGNSVGQKKRASTVGELMRVQLQVSEQIDSRVRRAMLRVAAGQVRDQILLSFTHFLIAQNAGNLT